MRCFVGIMLWIVAIPFKVLVLLIVILAYLLILGPVDGCYGLVRYVRQERSVYPSYVEQICDFAVGELFCWPFDPLF